MIDRWESVTTADEARLYQLINEACEDMGYAAMVYRVSVEKSVQDPEGEFDKAMPQFARIKISPEYLIAEITMFQSVPALINNGNWEQVEQGIYHEVAHILTAPLFSEMEQYLSATSDTVKVMFEQQTEAISRIGLKVRELRERLDSQEHNG